MRQLRISKQFTNRDAHSFNAYLMEVSSIPMITAEEELVLCEKIKNGDEKALEKLINANLRFVVSVAKQYNNRAPLQDLIQEGNEGLMVAARRFDATKGFKFISYAVWWIRQSILQYLSENSRKIRIPLNKINSINKINSATIELEQYLERSPTVYEISEHLMDIESKSSNGDPSKFTEEKIKELTKQSQFITSIDAPMTADEDSGVISDALSGEDYSDDGTRNSDLNIELSRALKNMSERDREILTMCFGLFGNKAKSLDEIGGIFNLTRERVRQIREAAIKKLAARSKNTQLKEYI